MFRPFLVRELLYRGRGAFHDHFENGTSGFVWESWRGVERTEKRKGEGKEEGRGTLL